MPEGTNWQDGLILRAAAFLFICKQGCCGKTKFCNNLQEAFDVFNKKSKQWELNLKRGLSFWHLFFSSRPRETHRLWTWMQCLCLQYRSKGYTECTRMKMQDLTGELFKRKRNSNVFNFSAQQRYYRLKIDEVINIITLFSGRSRSFPWNWALNWSKNLQKQHLDWVYNL